MKNYAKYLLVLVAVVILVVAYIIYQKPSIQTGVINQSGVHFRLLDGDTDAPIANKELLVCDDSVKLDWDGSVPYKRFCDDRFRKIHGRVSTDANGELYFDITRLNIFDANIVFDDGNSFVGIERSDSLGHTHSPDHLRVFNSAKDGTVISNKIYDLTKKEVKEIFIGGDEKIYPFEIVEIETLAD